MKNTKTVKEAYIFLGLTIAFPYFVFWGPLALFKIPTISFVSEVNGPTWAIALFLVGGFVPSNKSDSSEDVHSVAKLFKNNHGRLL